MQITTGDSCTNVVHLAPQRTSTAPGNDFPHDYWLDLPVAGPPEWLGVVGMLCWRFWMSFVSPALGDDE